MRSAFALFICALATQIFAKEKWDPVNPVDLAATHPSDGEQVDAEAIFVRAELINDRDGSLDTVYRRVKVYTKAGVDHVGKIEIFFSSAENVSALAVRLLKPNGDIREFGRKDFSETTVVKNSDSSGKTKAFVVPDLAPGDILDTRWTISSKYLIAPVFFCQESIPIRKYNFRLESRGVAQRFSWYNLPTAKMSNTADGLELQVQDLPAFIEEPNMPPVMDFRGMIRIHFDRENITQAQGWADISRELASNFREHCTVDATVRRKAEELTRGLTDPMEKLRAIHRYCHENIINVVYDSSPASVKKLNASDYGKPRDTIKDGRGVGSEIDWLFAALSSAAGFETKLARCVGRHKLSSANVTNGWEFLSNGMVAVKVGEKYHFFSPAESLMPYGMLYWHEEGVLAVLGNAKELDCEVVPLSPPEATVKLRKADLKMSEDGSLEGDVVETDTGFFAGDWRRTNRERPRDEREKQVRDEFTKRVPEAEITGLEFRNDLDPDKPLEIHYHIHLPEFVTFAGDSVILTPNIFCAGEKPLFTAAQRRYPIAFEFAHQAHDDISITLPETFSLKSGDIPPPISAADGAITQEVKMSYGKKKRVLHFLRNFSLGAHGALTFEAKSYGAFKSLFERLQSGNVHAVILERTAP